MDSVPQNKIHSVLVVVENKSIAKNIVTALKSNGLQPILAPDAGQAFAALKAQPVDLILLDLLPLSMDVWEVCKKIMGNPATQAIPLISFAQSKASENFAVAFSYGAIDHVNIFFDNEELITRVKFHLSMKYEAQKLHKSQSDLFARNQELEVGNQRLNTLKGKVIHLTQSASYSN